MKARPRRVAVVLNMNARRVDDETLGWMANVVPEGDLFVSRSVDDAPRIADQLVAARYDAVMWGGGDGTFAAGVAALADSAARRGASLPDVGVLRLGTGNGLAYAVGAGEATREGLAADVQRARQAKATRRLALLDVEGRPTMFAGFGLDAQILQDLHATIGLLGKVGLERHLRSAVARYALAVAGRSIPRFLLSDRVEVVAVNRGAPALRMDVQGRVLGEPIPAGRVLWRGKATLAAVSTIPYYGLAMKMFPHADRRPGLFQLRLTDVSSATILAHLPAIWQGTYGHDRIHDFLVDDVELVLSRPTPMQSGGDLLGDRSRARFSRWHRPIAVV